MDGNHFATALGIMGAGCILGGAAFIGLLWWAFG